MNLRPIPTVETISPNDFKANYYNTSQPLIIKGLAKQWPAYTKWNWDYFIDIVGQKKWGI
ncbi:cupin-like domain-containing protein [Niabella defluvii]|nr:cupin-like domain-containing protein [Niabella sp. I65]